MGSGMVISLDQPAQALVGTSAAILLARGTVSIEKTHVSICGAAAAVRGTLPWSGVLGESP